jgi:glycosyltransferase involved in cell wall biosynthesis
VAKLGILAKTPRYIREIRRVLKTADVVHVRCPANISLLAVIVLCFVREPKVRWIKYAGNWSPTDGDPTSYRFQRWMLRGKRHRAQVTVNGEWQNQPPHVHSFQNPCLTAEELKQGHSAACAKSVESPVRLLFVGRVETPKGAGRALEIAAKLVQSGLRVQLDLIGDGPEREAFEQQSRDLGFGDCVNFHGWLPRTSLEPFLRQAHFLLLPTSASEGWPKVLSEGMAYGAIPLAGDVSGIDQTLSKYGIGAAVPASDIDGFCREIERRLANEEAWKEEMLRCCHAANEFSYDNYLSRVSALLHLRPRAGA